MAEDEKKKKSYKTWYIIAGIIIFFIMLLLGFILYKMYTKIVISEKNKEELEQLKEDVNNNEKVIGKLKKKMTDTKSKLDEILDTLNKLKPNNKIKSKIEEE